MKIIGILIFILIIILAALGWFVGAEALMAVLAFSILALFVYVVIRGIFE